jgi:hypothetical protein
MLPPEAESGPNHVPRFDFLVGLFNDRRQMNERWKRDVGRQHASHFAQKRKLGEAHKSLVRSSQERGVTNDGCERAKKHRHPGRREHGAKIFVTKLPEAQKDVDRVIDPNPKSQRQGDEVQKIVFKIEKALKA